jgi:hypothetical protein
MNAAGHTQRDPDQVRQECAKKLRTVVMAEHYRAVLGCLLGEKMTERQPTDLAVSKAEEISGPCEDGETFSAWIDPPELLLRNASIIAETCEFDGEELAYLVARVTSIKREQ